MLQKSSEVFRSDCLQNFLSFFCISVELEQAADASVFTYSYLVSCKDVFPFFPHHTRARYELSVFISIRSASDVSKQNCEYSDFVLLVFDSE